MSELTVYSFQAALYTLNENTHEWVLADMEDDPIAQYYVFMDDANPPKFRMVGWVDDTGEVVLNNPLTKDCIWLPLNEYFVQFTTPSDITVGLSFIDTEQAQEASTVVQRIIQNMKGWTENNNGTEGATDETSHLAAELKDYLTFVRTHGISSLEYFRSFSPTEMAHVVDDLDTIIFPTEVACVKESKGTGETHIQSFLSDKDRESFQLQFAAAQLSLSKAAPPARRSYSVPQLFVKEEVRRGSCPLGPAPLLRRCSSSLNSSVSSRSSSRRQSLANFDEVERATMAAVDSNLQNEDDSPDFLRTTFGTFTGVGPRASCRGSDDTQISRPFQTKQELHVTFNVELARYEGLPAAWQSLNKQFGLPLDAVPKRKVDGYDGKIPAVLQMMKEYLIEHGGLETEGIFRLAPDKEECNHIKEAINSGLFVGCNDIHIVANLIKVWFRELPISIFNAIPEKVIYKTCELKDPVKIMSILKDVPDNIKSVILWLLDLMAAVVLHESKTKMSTKNMAIVLSPNLFSIASDNPMVALTMSQKVAEFTTVMLNARLALEHKR